MDSIGDGPETKDNSVKYSTLKRAIATVPVILLLVISASLCANPRPQKVESIDISHYRRVTGSPGTAFYFLKKKGGFEVKSFAENTSYVRTLAHSRKLQTSAAGNYFAVIAYNNFRPTDLRIIGIDMFDREGNRLWSINDPDCNSFVMTDAAPIVVGISGAEGLPESELRFFNDKGKLLNSVRIDHMANVSISDDGRYVFVVSGSRALLKFTSGGNKLGEYPVTTHYRVSRDGSLVGVLLDTLVRIYSRDNVLCERRVPRGEFRDLKFSGDDSQAALLSSERLEIVDLKTEITKLLWPIQAPGYRLVDLATDDDFSYFLCSSNNSAARPEVRDSQGKVFLLGADGQTLWHYDLTYVSRAVGTPKVQFDRDRHLLSILSAEKLELFKL